MQKSSDRSDLARIFQKDVDLISKPLTPTEEEFLNLITAHFLTGWRIAKSGGVTTLKEMKADARGVFSLPLPRAA